MATQAQIEANRLNSQKSSGPRTPEGKTASSMNALKHGLDARSAVLPGEDPEAYARLAEGYFAQFQPRSAEELQLVRIIIDSDWSCRRYRLLETATMNRMLAEMEEPDLGALFLASNPSSKLLDRIIRHKEAATRTWFRAIRDLKQLLAEDDDEMPDDDEIDLMERTQFHSLLQSLRTGETRPQPPAPAAQTP